MPCLAVLKNEESKTIFKDFLKKAAKTLINTRHFGIKMLIQSECDKFGLPAGYRFSFKCIVEEAAYTLHYQSPIKRRKPTEKVFSSKMQQLKEYEKTTSRVHRFLRGLRESLRYVDQNLMTCFMACLPQLKDKMALAEAIVYSDFTFRPYFNPALSDDPHARGIALMAWNRWTTKREKRSYIFSIGNQEFIVDPPEATRTRIGRVCRGFDKLWLERPEEEVLDLFRLEEEAQEDQEVPVSQRMGTEDA